jgi:hypothetical protein
MAITKVPELQISRRTFLKLIGYGFIVMMLSGGNINKLLSAYASSSQNRTNLIRDGKNRHELNNTYFDKFGIKKIYPTKELGREWAINMDDITNDSIFDPQAETERNSDGSWRIGHADRDEGINGKYHIVMNVDTPQGQNKWKNVEITGYIKVTRVDEEEDAKDIGLQWYARGNRHSSDVPCQGTSLKGRIHPDGSVAWIKEIWHDGGYTREKSVSKATDSLKDRWIGWKAIMYNIENETAVKMETYLDDKADNNWVKVTDLIDRGDWYCNDDRFDEAHCHRPRNYVVNNDGPKVAFRSDGVEWDFKFLSVREIEATNTLNQ